MLRECYQLITFKVGPNSGLETAWSQIVSAFYNVTESDGLVLRHVFIADHDSRAPQTHRNRSSISPAHNSLET